MLRSKLDEIAIDGGFPVEGLRLIFALVMSCFIAPILHIFPCERSKHLANICIGVGIGIFVLDFAILHAIGTSIAVYISIALIPRTIVGTIVPIALFLYLAGCHFYREYYSPDIVWDAAQMILTLKLSSIAINYSDGGAPSETKKNQLISLPPLLSYFGYVFFFPTFLAGPVYEYKYYVQWMQMRKVAPLSVHLRNFFVVAISAAGLLASQIFPIEEMDKDTFYPEHNRVWRCFLMCVGAALYRFRYYFAWSLAEASSALAGVGFVSSTGQWNGMRNVNLFLVELPTNIRVCVNNWNIGVAKWINTYVYQRVALSKKTGKPTVISTMCSFFLSAIWHGLSTSYYISFLLVGIYIECGKQLRRRLRPFFHYTDDRSAHPHAIFMRYTKEDNHPLAVIYDVGGVILTWVAMQYAGFAFEFLDVKRCLSIWATWYFLPHIVTISILVISAIIPPPRMPSQRKSN